MSRAIVNVSTGPAFLRCQVRLIKALNKICSTEKRIFWIDMLPSGSPDHQSVPFGFKLTALSIAAKEADVLLWADSSILPLRSMEPIWQLIERQGYWFSRNYDLMTDQFCSDAAKQIFDLSEYELAAIPQVIATSFGLDMSSAKGKAFFVLWQDYMRRGAFTNGPSACPRYIGHRHDQTAASVVAWDLHLNLTDPPKYIAEGGQEHTNETILSIERCR